MTDPTQAREALAGFWFANNYCASEHPVEGFLEYAPVVTCGRHASPPAPVPVQEW